MTLTEFKTQLLSLTWIEKAEVIQALTQTLSNGSRGIIKTPGVMGRAFSFSKMRSLYSKKIIKFSGQILSNFYQISWKY